MSDADALVQLTLHKSVFIAPFTITRVPNGYIYQLWDHRLDDHKDSGVFVPE